MYCVLCRELLNYMVINGVYKRFWPALSMATAQQHCKCALYSAGSR